MASYKWMQKSRCPRFADYEPRKTRLIVAAIDFGTTYSGYAYSFLDEYKKDPFKIYANADWSDGSGMVTPKAPTVVLFDKARRFHSFGYDAETRYEHLATEDEHEGWRYFRRFTMTLFQNNRLSRSTQIDDEQGQKMLALDVFAAAIQFLKDQLLARLRDNCPYLRPTDIDWVLTVPALWEDPAKQFMTIAADQAGIPDDQLTLVNEYVATAVFCKEIKDLSKERGQASELKSSGAGSKFMVIDLGGAVMYGYKPDSFCSRKMPFTNGFADYGPRKTRLVVAAIDFGTTYSGYAYSFLDEYKKDPFKIYANADLSDGSGLVTPKAPTIVLFDKAKRFHSFGYTAETKYNHLANEDKHEGWRYFRRFKMTLFQNNRLSLRTEIDDEQGQKRLALDVFAAAIQFLKDHLVARMRKWINDFRPTDIDWVLTVPAIWEDAAKQFMTIAANQAGIPRDQLTLAYEPEAAAVYCKEIKVGLSTERDQASELMSFSEGSKFMVIDLGGGTADITVHEVQNDRKLAALAAQSGGPWGGTLVDRQLDKFLIGLFGKDVIEKFSEDCKLDKLDMDRLVEVKKRQINSSSDKVHIKLPNQLFELYRELKNKDFDKSLLETDFSQTVSKKRDRLHVANTIFLDMFRESKEKLINHVEAQLRRTDLRNVKTIMMVGGFSESEIMQEAIKKRFEDKGYEVIVPEQASLAVVKGAVMYGHNPDSICSRKMPFTYGISTAVPFENSMHARVHRYVRADGKEMCEDIFKTFIVKGEKVVPRKTSAEHTFQSPAAGNTRVTVEVYKSVEDTPPMYTTDCKRVGELVLHTRSCQVDQKALIKVQMMFGGTKVSVEAQELKAQVQGTKGMNKVEAEFDWLKN